MMLVFLCMSSYDREWVVGWDPTQGSSRVQEEGVTAEGTDGGGISECREF